MSVYLALSVLSLAIWVHLVLYRGDFWRERPMDAIGPMPAEWPAVVAIVPARNEGDVIGRAMAGLIGQDYPGEFAIVLVDDQSTDETAARAKAAAGEENAKLTLISGVPLPEGWVGKMWALAQGVEQAAARFPHARYYWFTDADIGHEADNLRRLVARAEGAQVDLVSQMVRLDTSSFAEACLIPAFVYFFAMLFPFGWSNDPRRSTAAAAGGSMLVRTDALAAIGSIAAIKAELIDDCALAGKIKARVDGGGLHLSLTEQARSLRSYGGFVGVGRMIARSAYTQLNYAPLALVGTVLGLAVTFLAPPLLVLLGGWPALPALLAYGLMSLSFWPILDTYRLSPLYALGLPLYATCYLVFTVQSAIAYYQGAGGAWKGRTQAPRGQTP